MRKKDDGEKKRKRKKEKEKKITVEIVATHVVASRPPNGDRLQHRPLVPIFWSIKIWIKKAKCCLNIMMSPVELLQMV